MENNQENENPIIQFAEAVQARTNLSASQKDLLIREFMRNHEKIIPKIDENKKDSMFKSLWIKLMFLSLSLAIIALTVSMTLFLKQYENSHIVSDLHTLFVGCLVYIVICTVGYIRKW